MDGDLKHKTNKIQVISRAADILRAVREAGEGMSLGQIARAVGLPRSTVQRIVAALAEEGFVTTDSAGFGVRLGPEIRVLADASVQATPERLRPIMQRVAEQTGETVDLAVLDGPEMLFVDQVVGGQRLRTVSAIGDRFPVMVTANGKAALACLSDHEVARIVPEMPISLARELMAIRNGALATDNDEHSDGVSALGFALRDGAGDVYAISVPVPSSRFQRQTTVLRSALFAAREEASAVV